MEAHPRTLSVVFQRDVRLTVPLFQRPYVWAAEKQWEPLWEDVLATLGRSEHEDPVTSHFMGAIVLEQRRGATGSMEVREIIDGQQRLTTLQLLIAAIRDTFVAHGIENRTVKRLGLLLENDAELIDADDERHKLWPTNRDRDAYRDVMNGRYRAFRGTLSSIPRIAAAYVWFHGAIADLVGQRKNDSEVQEVLEGLAEVVRVHLELVVIDLGEGDNAQVIFETLNARSTPLRASDLIKNLLFRTLEAAGRPVESLYKRHWSELEEEEWQTVVRQGRLTRPRLDAFMGYFLTVLLTREVQAHQLFPVTRTYVGLSADRAEEFLRELTRYAAVYRLVDDLKVDDQGERDSLARLRIVDTQTLMPLLLWLFANTDGEARARSLRALESYVIRRSVCRLTTANYNRLFLELLRKLSSGEQPVDEVVSSFLGGQTSSSGLWPTDEDVRSSLQQFPLYRLLKRDSLQRLLFALNEELTTSLTEPGTFRKLTVEHLMPQSWATSWPLPDDAAQAARLTDDRHNLVHTLGNLTLVTGSLNSTLSNGPWTAKRRHLLEHSALTLNRSLPEYWDVDRIVERSQFLAEVAIQLWPRPAPAPGMRLSVADAERNWRPDRVAPEQQPGSAPTVQAKPSASGRRTGRRDIGKHIVQVFEGLPEGTFLTTTAIAKRPTPEYPDAAASPGAVAARLFPASGYCTVPGVTPVRRDGVRGAVKGA
ncbi:MAG: DUF262 domain-containing protein [Actinobacteria bacterium]|nr:DUF262 domain-containing protein [Actinomycetota bacterium]